MIIGGGDTGADCLGTAHRQGAASVTSSRSCPGRPSTGPDDQPWPTYPLIYRVSAAHEEGGERVYSVTTDGVRRRRSGPGAGAAAGRGGAAEGGRFAPVPGTERELPVRPGAAGHGLHRRRAAGLLTDLGVELDARGNVARDGVVRHSVPGVFVAGDMGRGQSLIVWAIAEGRVAAAAVDRYLAGDTPACPVAIRPTARPLT